MSRAAVLIIGVLVLALGGGLFWLFKPSGENLSSPKSTAFPESKTTAQPTPPESPVVSIPENIVNYTNSGYSPSSLKVKLRTTVSFQNNTSSSMWTASSPHPQHTGYPGSGISKCNGAEKAKIFDACNGILAGSSWSFTFDKAGTWGYHNHLNPSHSGAIVVE